MNLTVPIPESPKVPASQVVSLAARRAGYTPEHEGTAEEYLAAYLAEHVHQLYGSARVDEVVSEVRANLPSPERPARRVAVEADDGAAPPERAR